jgi:hypothetical protein
MPAPDLTQIALFVIGAFYVAGGFLATRAALTSRFIDRAIAAIAMEPVDRRETQRYAWLLTASVLILAGGAALLVMSQLAVPLFVVSAAGQAAYIYVAAPHYFDKADPPDERGRRATRNAFFVYMAATAFVVLSALGGSLFPPEATSPVAWIAFAGIVAAQVGYIGKTLAAPKPSRTPAQSSTPDGEPPEPLEPIDPASIKAVLVMADYQVGPLWLDDGRSDPIPTEMVDMPAELATALDTWARAYDMSFNHEDYSKPLWTDEQYEAHSEAGKRLAVRLAAERPDLKVRFWSGGRHHDI